MCKKFCVARKLDWVDDLIVRLVMARLSQPDALAVFAEPDDDADLVLNLIREKRARLEGFYESAVAGEITPHALGRIESSLLAEIDALDSGIKRYDVPTVVYDLARNPAERWASLGLEQKREVIRCLMTIRLHRSTTVKGSKRFDPSTVHVDWRGSDGARPVALPSAGAQPEAAS
ncbi:MAG: hypothetical protein LC749_05815 [Actinobacteria bacterium]|nr:hypothetical protein [Actinomycetota bacterium]